MKRSGTASLRHHQTIQLSGSLVRRSMAKPPSECSHLSPGAILVSCRVSPRYSAVPLPGYLLPLFSTSATSARLTRGQIQPLSLAEWSRQSFAAPPSSRTLPFLVCCGLLGLILRGSFSSLLCSAVHGRLRGSLDSVRRSHRGSSRPWTDPVIQKCTYYRTNLRFWIYFITFTCRRLVCLCFAHSHVIVLGL